MGTGLKSGSPVRSRNGDHHGGFPHVKDTYAVVYRYFFHGKSRERRCGNVLHFFYSHGRIRLKLQTQHLAALRAVADIALKRYHAPCAIDCYRPYAVFYV